MIESTRALWDWRRQVAATYAAVREAPSAEAGWRLWRSARDSLFRTHPQSPLEPRARAGFHGLRFPAYAPALRFAATLAPASGDPLAVPAGADGEMRLRPFAVTEGLAGALGGELTLYWIEGYGGGVLLPFADASSGAGSYGAGRYLIDTIKGADLGEEPDGRVVIDFNFAYNPSCCYSDRYVCPLAPATNRLRARIEAGEQDFAQSSDSGTG